MPGKYYQERERGTRSGRENFENGGNQWRQDDDGSQGRGRRSPQTQERAGQGQYEERCEGEEEGFRGQGGREQNEDQWENSDRNEGDYRESDSGDWGGSPNRGRRYRPQQSPPPQRRRQ